MQSHRDSRDTNIGLRRSVFSVIPWVRHGAAQGGADSPERRLEPFSLLPPQRRMVLGPSPMRRRPAPPLDDGGAGGAPTTTYGTSQGIQGWIARPTLVHAMSVNAWRARTTAVYRSLRADPQSGAPSLGIGCHKNKHPPRQAFFIYPNYSGKPRHSFAEYEPKICPNTTSTSKAVPGHGEVSGGSVLVV